MFTWPRLKSTHADLRETLQVLGAREQLARRRVLAMLGTAGAAALLPSMASSCVLIPSETAGPYPGDGTNNGGLNVLNQSGIVRADIRPSFGSAGTTVAGGTLLTVTLRLVSSSSSCAPLEGLAVYLWHCTANGLYSLYSNGVTNQNYLRGVQVTDANGEVTFTTIFPGCYAGRWPHIHFEVFSALANATVGSAANRISQLALPESVSRAVYAQNQLYSGSTTNLNGVTLASDNVFRDDNAINQMATVAGDNNVGYAALLEVGVNLTPTSSPNLIFSNGFELS